MWDAALNFVDEKVQELKHIGFGRLTKHPYCSELRESNTDVTFTLFADPRSETMIRVVVRAQTTAPIGRSFAHGFDLHRDGRIGGLSAAELGAFE